VSVKVDDVGVDYLINAQLPISHRYPNEVGGQIIGLNLLDEQTCQRWDVDPSIGYAHYVEIASHIFWIFGEKVLDSEKVIPSCLENKREQFNYSQCSVMVS
jgi:hypothetical protein